jgi:hypothetical protein
MLHVEILIAVNQSLIQIEDNCVLIVLDGRQRFTDKIDRRLFLGILDISEDVERGREMISGKIFEGSEVFGLMRI